MFAFKFAQPIMIQKVLGDTLRVMRNTGGGGGHALTVKDFQMTILHKRRAADDQEGGEVTFYNDKDKDNNKYNDKDK